MPSAGDLHGIRLGAVVAPAGHGKTELIAQIASLGSRALVLTHTHAGVHAIRGRMRRLGVPVGSVSVDTIAGWCTRYAHAFPGIARPPAGDPTGDGWEKIYTGATGTLAVSAVREVIAASYDRILIDEYQDCGSNQHLLAIELGRIIPTLIFGDPMQGIFEWARPSLHWGDEIHPQFPLLGTLKTPHRWANTNVRLGSWVAQTREALIRGETIDLRDSRITYRQTNDAFDMGALFDGLETKNGNIAAIHCNKPLCYALASATNGGYQAIEEVAGKRLGIFAAQWDQATDAESRWEAIKDLRKDCFHRKPNGPDESIDEQATQIAHLIRESALALGNENGCEAAAHIFAIARRHPRWKLFRAQLWRDAERALLELAARRSETLAEAASRIRYRTGAMGRSLPARTVSTPLLLKGLEFDHVVLPDASHFAREPHAQAKLFYVAISRATKTLTITAPEPFLTLPAPRL